MTDIEFAEDGRPLSLDLGDALDRLVPNEASKRIQIASESLADGGILSLLVTDFDFVVDGYKAGTVDAEDLLCGVDGELKHSIWNRAKLADLVNLHGFEIVSGYDGGLKWTNGKGQIGVRAAKRRRKSPPNDFGTKIHAVMSLPRIAWTETFANTIESVARLQMPFTKTTGVFWGQCLERTMASVSELPSPPDYILTIDYDGIFDPRDVVRLWQIMEDNPDIAALCPMQIGRERSTVLANVIDKEGRPVTTVGIEALHADALEISSGHFGLTLIRTSVLREMSHPWFLGIPNAEGRWDENRTDDDIYFWHKLRASGKRICVTPKVRLGHLQLVITWPSDDLSCVHQYLGEFHANGRPTQCSSY